MANLANIIVHGATHVGRQRDRNEDAFFIGKLMRTMFVQGSNLSFQQPTWLAGGSESWLLVVADGMGGQGDGELASEAAVLAVTDYLWNASPWLVVDAMPRSPAISLPGLREQLADAVSAGELNVRQVASQPNVSSRMGTTLTLAYICWPNLYVAHVGDSRCYLLRNGRLLQLTTDHTMAQRLATEGLQSVTPSSPLNHILWNALGGDDAHAQPEVSRIELGLEDQLLLCSDGLTRHLNDGALLEALAAKASVVDSVNGLIAAANDAGGSDNVTVIEARFESVANPAQTDFARAPDVGGAGHRGVPHSLAR